MWFMPAFSAWLPAAAQAELQHSPPGEAHLHFRVVTAVHLGIAHRPQRDQRAKGDQRRGGIHLNEQGQHSCVAGRVAWEGREGLPQAHPNFGSRDARLS